MTPEDVPRFAFAMGRDADGFFEAMNDARFDGYNLISVTPSATAWLGVFEHEDVVLAREVRGEAGGGGGKREHGHDRRD